MSAEQQNLFENICQHCGEDLTLSARKKRGRPSSKLIEKQFTARDKAIRSKIRNEFEQRVSVLKEELAEYKLRNEALRDENKDLFRQLRSLHSLKDDSDLRVEQELFRKEEAFKKEISARLEAQYELREKELTKKIDDTKKTVATLDAQVNERSSRLMGEALELSLHERLVNLFPNDIIEEVKVGVRGADVSQIVIDDDGKKCGTIMWEAKNAKWQSAWVSKLESDLKDSSSDIGIIVGTKLYQEKDFLALASNIFATSPFGVEAVAHIARRGLILNNRSKILARYANNNSKEVIKYFSGKTFEKKLNDIVASSKKQRNLVDNERAFFQKKWASQEIDISSQLALVSELLGELSALFGINLSENQFIKTSEDESPFSGV